ncbi:uncharacterized protein TNCV_1031491 [Trichonephila clavipes]|nr:uncharacterized protein TNCV_1031491 [Trichonephila clavipes]
MLRDYMKDRGLVIGRVGRTRDNPKDVGKHRVRRDRARETMTIPSGGNSAAERRPVRSRQATAGRPCPYYLRSQVKQPEGIPEEQRNNGIHSKPQNNLRRRSLSMEALDGDPVDRSE